MLKSILQATANDMVTKIGLINLEPFLRAKFVPILAPSIIKIATGTP
jgi:hypothetical protein